MKRIALFLITNVLIVLTISITISVFGLYPKMNAYGLDYQSLAIFCLVWGMAGAFISLLISRWTAKLMVGAKVIDPDNAGQFGVLVQDIKDISRAAGLETLPEIAVYQSPELNAFATGPSKKRSLVAVSTGLLSAMNRDELRGVLAHEIAHIKNGDMITMTLLQGIINAVVMFLARAIAFVVTQSNNRSENSYFMRYLITIALEIALSLLGMIVVFWFSRQREFRADGGAAKLVGPQSMISALQRLKLNYELAGHGDNAASLATMKISNLQERSWFGKVMSSHPPLDDRIAALQRL